MENYQEIELNEDELWLLLSQYGPGIIVGIRNPYEGQLAQETQAANEAAFQSLVQRGILQIVSESEVFLPEGTISMLGVCHHPDYSVIVQYQHSSDPIKRTFFHYGDNLITELQETEPGRYRLATIVDKEALIDRLGEALCANSSANSEGKPFLLSENAFYKARSLSSAGETDLAAETLVSAGLTPDAARCVIETFTAPPTNASYVVIANRNTPEMQFVRGFSVLGGTDNLWIMEPYEENDEKMITFTPANADGVRARFSEILPRRSDA